MPIFAYQAARENGMVESGEVSALSPPAAFGQLRARGLTPISLSEVGQGGGLGQIMRSLTRAAPRRGRLDERATLFRTLSPLLAAGIRPERAVALAAQMASYRAVQNAARRWVEDMRGGLSLAAAMARTPDLIPETLSQAIAAAETSGKLGETVERIAASIAAAQETRNRVISALAYPALLTVTMCGVLGLMFTTVIPNLTPLFEQAGAQMPWPAAVLVGLSRLSEAYGGLALAFAIALMGSFAVYARGERGRIRFSRMLWNTRVLDRLPAKAAAAGFAGDLSLLLAGGVPLSRAFDLAVLAVGSAHFRAQLFEAKRALRQGKTLKSALAPIPNMPGLLVEMAGVGDETGKHAPALARAADILNGEVQRSLDRATAMILPVMTLVLGAIVAMIMTGIVTGILAANELAL